ncbi:MAG: DUF927 domain-containing protein [Desulfuromonadaceae bacterium]|nr:DUF927 domain-containing protein [Desulfuromonadaceae bacterium]
MMEYFREDGRTEQACGVPLPPDFCMSSAGLYYRDEGGDTLYLCPPFKVLGRCCEADGSQQGLVLCYNDLHGQSRRLILKYSDLASGPGKLLQRLLDKGLMAVCSPVEARCLQQFFYALRPSQSCRLVRQRGWVDDQHFVLPGEVVGPQREQIICADHDNNSLCSTRSDLNGWRQAVSCLSCGNPSLLFAQSLAFAAPLMPLTGVDPGIFHLVAPTSSGKTSILHAVASLSGPPATIHSWNVSEAGLEAAATSYNHRLLLLDEFAEIPPRRAQSLIYQITNGRAGLRAESQGGLRPPYSWQTLVLSAGEITLEEHCQRLHVPLVDGQKVRLIDLAMPDTLFEDLHSVNDAATFSQQLVTAACQHYGTALPAYLTKLCDEDKNALRQEYDRQERAFLAHYFSIRSENQGALRRVARRFFLAGYGGELATRYGITGWQEGEALQAAHKLLSHWLHQRHKQLDDQRQQTLDQLYSFLEQHLQRFINLDDASFDSTGRPNLAGYYATHEDTRDYFIKAPVMTRQILKGLDKRAALNYLVKDDLLKPCPHGGVPYVTRRLPRSDSPPQRVYHIRQNLDSPRERMSVQTLV